MENSQQNRKDNGVNLKKKAYSIVIVSIIFAAAMIASSTIFADSDKLQTIIFLLIAAWFIPFFYIIKVKDQSSNS